MSNNLVLYHMHLSPPCRAVRVVAKLLGLELELREVNLLDREHLKEPFRKMNPEHCLPTLDDNGFIIWESHSICAYLVDKYGKDDKLYPKDFQLRAKCNQRFFFDTASIFVRLRDCGVSVFYKGATEIPQDKIDTINSAFDVLEVFLAKDPFLVGNNLTIADICMSLTLPFLNAYVPLKTDKHANIVLNRVKQTIPFFEEMNENFDAIYDQLVLGMLESNRDKK